MTAGRLALLHRLYRALGTNFRSKRMSAFESFAQITPRTTVLDVGGAPATWDLVRPRPRVVILNVELPDADLSRALAVVADGTHLPFRDKAFDVAFSNSVIEHVGGEERQRQFAREIVRVSTKFYVQTPNRWFPVEPHVMTPLVHFVPVGLRRKLLRNFTVWGLITRPSQGYVDSFVAHTRLLAAGDLASMFPDGHLLRERVLGLTKSLTIRSASRQAL